MEIFGLQIWFFLLITFLVFDFVILFFIFGRKKKKFNSQELQYMRSHWVRIIDSADTHSKQAILDADKLLDYALSKKGFQGNLGQKLKVAEDFFSDLNGIWRAHKLRNRVAHELAEISLQEAKFALKSFQRALNDLGVNL